MSRRELAVRVPSELGSWVRAQPGSATETILAIASDVYKGRQPVTVADPGAGEDRLKIRMEPRALRFIRAATHSRETASAIRKLLRFGKEGRALRAAPSRAFLKASVMPVVPLAAISRPRLSDWEGVHIPAGAIPAHSSRGMALASWQGASAVPCLPASDVPEVEVPASVSHAVLSIPERVLAIGLPIVLLAGAYFFLKWLSLLGSAGKVAAGMATAAKVAPVAEWMPQAATGLGALFL